MMIPKVVLAYTYFLAFAFAMPQLANANEVTAADGISTTAENTLNYAANTLLPPLLDKAESLRLAKMESEKTTHKESTLKDTPQAAIVGVVDRKMVVLSCPRAQEAANELRQSEDKVHALISESNNQYAAAKRGGLASSELEDLAKKLQNTIDDEVNKVQARAQVLENELETIIGSAIKAEAASRGIDKYFLKGSQLAGSNSVDFTEGVIKRLNSDSPHVSR